MPLATIYKFKIAFYILIDMTLVGMTIVLLVDLLMIALYAKYVTFPVKILTWLCVVDIYSVSLVWIIALPLILYLPLLTFVQFVVMKNLIHSLIRQLSRKSEGFTFIVLTRRRAVSGRVKWMMLTITLETVVVVSLRKWSVPMIVEDDRATISDQQQSCWDWVSTS